MDFGKNRSESDLSLTKLKNSTSVVNKQAEILSIFQVLNTK